MWSKLVYSKPELMYYYKGVVGIPPLQMVDDVMAIQKCSMLSLKLNTNINTFIELEKLTLSKKKCRNIHIGKQKSDCPALNIHGSKMEESPRETYLGDVVDQSGKIRPNIKARKARGYGIISEILTIIHEVPLAHWRIEAGLKFREAMLMNGILFDSQHDIIMLETERTPECSLKDPPGGPVHGNKLHSYTLHSVKQENQNSGTNQKLFQGSLPAL